MSRQRSLHTCSGPHSSSISGSGGGADRAFGGAEVISLDAARAIFRPLAADRRLMQEDDPQDRAWRESFLGDEPLLRFENFGGRS